MSVSDLQTDHVFYHITFSCDVPVVLYRAIWYLKQFRYMQHKTLLSQQTRLHDDYHPESGLWGVVTARLYDDPRADRQAGRQTDRLTDIHTGR